MISHAHVTAAGGDDNRPPEFRVFIASTFRDMQREREHLVKHLFQELHQRCRERGVEFTEVDLRWGITDEEARQGRIVGKCLDEIYQHRPFVICIIGSRYGWIPEAEEVERDHDLLLRYPGLRRAVRERRSLIDLEITEGVLNNPAMAGRALFYFRDPAADNGVPPEEGPEERAKLDDLKERIRRHGAPVREPFTDPATLGEWVREDLRRAIDQIYPSAHSISLLERERRAHEAFAATRRRAYVEDAEVMRRLDDHATGERTPLVIVGEPGAGKSALVAHWSTRYRQHHPEAFVVTHYIGTAASYEGDHIALLRHVMAEIRERCAPELEIPADAAAIENAFPDWLARVQGERLVLLVDALNQLDERSQLMEWLPEYLPPRVTLILSTTPGTARDALASRDWPELPIRSLTRTERDAIIRGYLGEYGKSFSNEQLGRVSQAPTSANPLFLRTSLEELRLFGSYEGLNEKIDYYLSANDLDELFRRVLTRWEEDYGAKLVREVLRHIWASRRGLTESDLHGIVGGDRTALSRFLGALDFHLMRCDGALTFFHDHLRQAVRGKYLATKEQRRKAHLRIAGHIADASAPQRLVDELPWLLAAAEEWEQLIVCIARPAIFVPLSGEDRKYELLGYWRGLRAAVATPDTFRRMVLSARETDAEMLSEAEAHRRIGNFFLLCGELPEAEESLKRSLDICERELGEDDPVTLECLHDLGSFYRETGDLDAAAVALRVALDRHRSRYGERHVATARVIASLASLLYDKRELNNAESLAEQALDIRIEAHGEEHRNVAESRSTLGVILYARREFSRARSLFEQALATAKRLYGKESWVVANDLNNFGAICYAHDDQPGAISYFRQALDINVEIFGADHPEIAVNKNNLAVLLKSTGKLEEAEVLYRESIAIDRAVFKGKHPRATNTLVSLAALLRVQGRFDEARELLEEVFARRKESYGEEHLETAYSALNLASLLKECGELEGSRELYERYLPILLEALGPNHPEATVAVSGWEDLQRRMGGERPD